MNDFLGRLAARELGANDALRPRLRSLFEPPAGVAGSMPTEAEAGVERPTPSIPVAHRVDPGSAPVARTLTPSPSLPPPAPALVAAHPSAPSAAAVPPRTPVGREAPASLVETRIERRESVVPEPQVSPAALPVVPPAVVQPVRVRAAAEVTPSPRRRLETREGVSSPVPRNRGSVQVIPASAPAAPHPPVRQVHAAAAAHPREETVVQVSIGRIEVRASGAKTPTPRQEGPRPMRLEEYLRKRSGRREA